MDVFGGAPRFLAYPRPVVVQSGTDAVLKCQIGGDPRPAVIWERNNEKLDPTGRYRVFEDGNIYNLIISSVTIEDSGQYICKAKNSIGETYAAATLKVEGEAQEMELREENKPRFLIKPLSTRAGRGEDAVFSCKLWGNPRPEVVWEKDGKKLNEIFESTHFNVGCQDGGWFQLKIFKTRAPDGGVYTCKARNEFGEALAGAVLLVDAGPGHEDDATRNGYTNGHWKGHQGKQRISRPLAHQLRDDATTKSTRVKMFAVTEGKHAKFRCFVTGKPKPEIIWRKDGRLILSGRRYLLYEDREGYFTLKVLYCKQKDNGVYVCAASNTAGQTISAVHLSVKEPLVRFKQPLIDLEVWERDLAILECEVPEDSVPITWYLEDRRLQPGAKYGMEEWGTKRRLTIRDIGVDDDGIYLCEMPDGGRSIAEVAVKGTILRKLPRKVDVLEGENAAFCVEVEKEEMDIHWYKDGVELRETHQTILKSFGRTHILVFVNTMPQDSGLVTFLVGRSKTSSQLRVKAAKHCPPSCPVGVQINTERANAALLSWVPAHDSRRNPPSGYVLERQEVGTGSQEWLQCLTTDSATSVEILGDSVPCEADYRFRICSVNKYGKSNNVEFPRAVHLVPVARIQAPLQDALVPEGQDAIFSIELSASVIGSWFLNGTQLQDDERFSMRRSRTHQSLRIQGVLDTDNGAEITFIAYGIRDSAALYIQAPLVKFSPLSEMDRNKFVEVGNPIVLYCELSDPATPVHWYRNGAELKTMEGLHIQSEGTMRRIVIQSAELSHSGVYCCDAIDDVIRFNVEVEAPSVRFTAIPDAERNLAVHAGLPATLQCEVSEPYAQVCWYKDGSKLHPQSSVDFQTEGSLRRLVIPTAEFYHSGLYCCKTKGDTVTFSLDVKVPPVKFVEIPDEMRTRSIEVGCPLVLRCKVSDPEARVCWNKDGEQLVSHSGLDMQSDENMRTLVIKSTELGHTGVYRCSTEDDGVDFQVEIKAPRLPLSPSPKVAETESLEATGPSQPSHEISDLAVQVSWQPDAEIDSNIEPDTDMGGIKKTLVIEPTHPAKHTGAYYCATADDVAQLIVKSQEPPETNPLGPEVEKTKPAEAHCPIVQQFEISDPIAKACWYTDGTQIYPKRGAGLELRGDVQAPPLQAGPVPDEQSLRCETPAGSELNVDVKAEQCHYGDEIGEVDDATAPNTVDAKAVPPRFSSDREKNMATEEARPDEVESVSSEDESSMTGGKNEGFRDHVEHSGLIVAPRSTDEHVTEWTLTEERAGISESRESTYADAPVQCNSVEPELFVCDPRDNVKLPKETQGEDFIYYTQHAEAPSERLVASLQTAVQWEELCNVPQTTVDIKGADIDTLTARPAKLHSSTPTAALSEPSGPVKTSTARSGLLTNHFSIVQSDEFCSSAESAAVQSEEEPFGSLLTSATVQAQELHASTCMPGIPPEEVDDGGTRVGTVPLEDPCNSLKTEIHKMEEMNDPSQVSSARSETPADIHNSASLGSVELQDFQMAKMVRRADYENASQAGFAISDDSRPREQVATDKPEVLSRSKRETLAQDEGGHREEAAEGHAQSTVVFRQRASAQFSDLYCVKPAIRSEDVYLERMCDSHWSDRVTANKVAVEVPPVSISTLCEAERRESMEVEETPVPHREISNPNAEVTWCKDGIEPHEGRDVWAEGPVGLPVIQSATPGQAAVYGCKTTDNAMHFHADVEVPPQTFSALSEADQEKSVMVGCPVTLQCELSDPDGQVSWYKDGTRLLPGSGVETRSQGNLRSVAFPSAQPAHSGVYRCQSKDDQVQFTLEVKALPAKFLELQEAEKDKTVQEGRSLILSCELCRDPSAHVDWYKDGVEVTGLSDAETQSDGLRRALVIQSAERTHSGIYECSTADDAVRFKVDVKGRSPQIMPIPESEKHRTLSVGSPIILQCEVSDPIAQVAWFKDDKELFCKTGLDMKRDGTLRILMINSAKVSDSAVYSCNLADDVVTFHVDVQVPPQTFSALSEADQAKTVMVGCPVTLQCELSDADGQVSWYKDGTQLLPESGVETRSQGNLRSLEFLSAQPAHSGAYSCQSKDDQVQFTLEVKAIPVTFSTLSEVARNKSVEAGCPVELRCEVSEPTARVHWVKEEQELLADTEYDIQAKEKLRMLLIKSAEVRHSGVYSCQAANDHIEFKVDVAALPESEKRHLVEAVGPAEHKFRRPSSSPMHSYEEGGDLCLASLDGKKTMVKNRVMPPPAGMEGGKTGGRSESDDCFLEAKAPPVTFVHVPEGELYKSAVERSLLLLSCEVSRDDGVVHWYKEGVEMRPGENVAIEAEGARRDLTIRSAQLADAGTYTCRAGDDVVIFKVNVREPPVMIIYPKEDVHLDRHVPEEVILSCELSRPSGEVSWYKDGQKLQESENIKLKVEGPYRRLKIVYSGVEDSGEYVCDTADDSIFFNLSITEPPVQIVSPSQSQMELCQQTSERMVLSCEISRPNAVVRWYRDGLEVEENHNLILEVDGVYRRLIIPETTVKDSAEYVCDTTDDSVTFIVNIAEPPVRFVRPRKMVNRLEKSVGDSLILDCEVSRSNAAVTWTRNGEEVEDTQKVTISEDGAVRQITIHSLTMEDAGQYVCDAKDDVMSFHVSIRELPVKILGKPDGKTERQFLVSDDIILVCELSRANASVSWYKDSQLIDDAARYCCEEQGLFRSLVVLNAGLEDSGEYTCDAADDRMVFYITVKEPPVKIIGNSGHPEHHILLAGDDLILECEVSRANAAVRWLRNGEELKQDAHVKIDSHDVTRKLVLSELQPSDSGEYVCDAGDDKLITIVEVEEAPVKFVNKTADAKKMISAYENESVTLCAVVSREKANVRWLKDGQLLNQDNVHISSEGAAHRLTINPLQLSDCGEYVCDVATDDMYFSLSVKEMKVKFTRPLENVAAQKGDLLTLRCEVNKAKGDVQWLKDGKEVSPSRRHVIRAQGRERSLTLHELAEEDAGEYACEATDDRTSAAVTVETPRVVEFIAELRHITVREGEDAAFKCVVSPEDTRLVWAMNGKQVAPSERMVMSSNGLCHMLCIHNCTPSDGGRVTANAEGLLSQAELQVQEQQVLFTKKMAPLVAEEHGEATLEAEVSLDGGEVCWMRQGVLIHPGPKYTLRRKGCRHSLTVHDLAVSDRGTYSCETLHDRTQAQLAVEPRKVTIRKGLTDQETTERETASLEVELSHEDVRGAWRRNGVPLRPSTHFRTSAKGRVHGLTICNLTLDDTATFMFCAENVKTSARLVVKEPPVTMFRKLEDQRFPEGAVISVECELSRHNVDVRWLKDGVEVRPGKDLRVYAMGRKRFLQVMKCQVADSGTYVCDAGDVATSCVVEVYERELLVLQGLQDVSILEDQNAVFVCEVSVEDVAGEWFRDGERIQPTSTVKIRQEGNKHFLLMCNVRPEDSGEIRFAARHVQSVARLEVEEVPVSIVRPLQDQTVLERSRVLLDCTVSNPRCSIRWYKGCSVVLPSERFEISSEGCHRKLIIQQVALRDEGTYSMQVGEFTCSARLTVEAQSLTVVRELRDEAVESLQDACFECELSAAVAEASVWSLCGAPLEPGPQVCVERTGAVHRLTLRATTADMTGEVEFTCGGARSTARLEVRK